MALLLATAKTASNPTFQACKGAQVSARMPTVRIPLMADSDSIPIADSVPCDGGHAARVSRVTLQS